MKILRHPRLENKFDGFLIIFKSITESGEKHQLLYDAFSVPEFILVHIAAYSISIKELKLICVELNPFNNVIP